MIRRGGAAAGCVTLAAAALAACGAADAGRSPDPAPTSDAVAGRPLDRAKALFEARARDARAYRRPPHLSRVLDVDGDHFGDLLVGCYKPGGGGRVFVYRGGPTGLEAAPAMEIPEPARGVGDGQSFNTMSDLGDIDGDAKSDVAISGIVFATSIGLVGPPLGRVDVGRQEALRWRADVDGDGWPDQLVERGGAAAIQWAHGGSAGLDLRGELVPPNGDATFHLHDGASFGDVDGDGYVDAILVASSTETSCAASAISVYRGGVHGLETTPWFTTSKRGQSDWLQPFEMGVLGVGDVDGDGFGDFVVQLCRSTILFRGAASPDRVRVEVEWSFHVAYASAGDFDGDGRADVAVGRASSEGTDGVDVYMGSTEGLSRTPTARLDPSREETGPCGFGTLAGAP